VRSTSRQHEEQLMHHFEASSEVTCSSGLAREPSAEKGCQRMEDALAESSLSGLILFDYVAVQSCKLNTTSHPSCPLKRRARPIPSRRALLPS